MKASTTVSLDSELLDEARRYAKDQRRSFSSQLEIWIEEKISEQLTSTEVDPSADCDLRKKRVVRAKDHQAGKEVA